MISQYTDYGRGAGENAYIMAFLLTEYLMVSFVIEGGLWYKMKYGLALGGGGRVARLRQVSGAHFPSLKKR